MTDLTKRDDALLPCPFCGGKASDTGFMTWSKALRDTHWDDGSEITEAYFCSCISCGVTNIVGNVGYRTKAEAIAAWNTRSMSAIEELVKERDYTEGTNDTLIALNQALEDKLAECEARLSKAVEALRWYDNGFISSKGRDVLAELEGK